jgi:hypothetical protein
MTKIDWTDDIVDTGKWDAETERFDCPDGHSILVVDTFTIEGIEGYHEQGYASIYHAPMVQIPMEKKR